MSCATLTNITADCKGSVGGIVKVYFADFGDGDFYTVTNDETTGQPTAVTDIDITSNRVVSFSFRRNTGSMTSTISLNEGLNAVATVVSLSFGHMEASKRASINALMYADTCAIVKDSNGKYWALGLTAPVYVSGGTGETGTNATDVNRYTVEVTDNAGYLPIEITSTEVINKLKDL